MLPTPDPGDTPVSVICTVVPSLAVLLEARASITITQDGPIFLTMPSRLSAVSMPVMPSTPGVTAATARSFSKPIAFASSPEI